MASYSLMDMKGYRFIAISEDSGSRSRTLEGPTPTIIEHPASGFAYFSSADLAESSPKMNDFQKVEQLRMGDIPIDQTGDVLAELNEKGYQEMLEEVARQYEAYFRQVQ